MKEPKSKAGAKRSQKRLELEKIDLIKDLKFNYSLIKLAEKYNVSKDLIQTILTQQLSERQRVNEARKKSHLDSGWEKIQLETLGFNEWLNSPERAVVKAYKIENFT